MRVVVVGAGIAGLGAAWELQRAGAHVTVLERDGEPGGRCRSARFAGRDVATGAFAFTERDTALIALADELGLRGPGQVEDLTEGHVQRMFRRDGRTHDVRSFTPASFLLLPFVPLREKLALARLGVLSARLALTGAFAAPELAAGIDRAGAADWFRRHAPVLHARVLEPSMGMFCGFREDEFSLAWLLWSNGPPDLRTAPIRWWTLADGGVGRFSRTLAGALVDRGADVRTGMAVDRVAEVPGGVVVTGGEEEVQADAVVVAVPAPAVPPLLPGLSEHRRRFFASFRYSAHDLAYYLTDDLGTPPGGSLGEAGIGLILSTAEGFGLASNAHWAPAGPGRSLVLVQSKQRHLGPLADASDDAVLDALWDELAGVTPASRSVRVHDRLLARWDAAIPTRPPGQLRELRRFRSLGPLPRIAFAGDHLRNSSVGNALVTGQQAAADLLGQERRGWSSAARPVGAAS